MSEFIVLFLIPVMAGVIVAFVTATVAVATLGVITLLDNIASEITYRLRERGGIMWDYVLGHAAWWILALTILWLLGMSGLAVVFK